MAITITRSYTEGQLDIAESAVRLLYALNQDEVLARGDGPIWRAVEDTLRDICEHITSGNFDEADTLYHQMIEAGEARGPLKYWAAGTSI